MTTLAELLALLPDNANGDISAEDMRTVVTGLWNEIPAAPIAGGSMPYHLHFPASLPPKNADGFATLSNVTTPDPEAATGLYRATSPSEPNPGRYVEWVRLMAGGTWQASAYALTFDVFGRLHVKIDGADSGCLLDGYSASGIDYMAVVTGSQTFNVSEGSHTIRFEVSSRNGAATAYRFAYYWLDLQKVA